MIRRVFNGFSGGNGSPIHEVIEHVRLCCCVVDLSLMSGLVFAVVVLLGKRSKSSVL